MNLRLATLYILVLAVACQGDLDQGDIRLRRLKERSHQTRNRIMTFSKSDFEYFPPHSGSM